MRAKFFIVAFFWFSHFCSSYESNISLSSDLVTPAMTQEDPAPGKRVRQVAPEYKGTKVYHTLYLLTDWQKQNIAQYWWSIPATSFPLADQPEK